MKIEYTKYLVELYISDYLANEIIPYCGIVPQGIKLRHASIYLFEYSDTSGYTLVSCMPMSNIECAKVFGVILDDYKLLLDGEHNVVRTHHVNTQRVDMFFRGDMQKYGFVDDDYDNISRFRGIDVIDCVYRDKQSMLLYSELHLDNNRRGVI